MPFALTLWSDSKVTKLIDARGQLTADQVKERLLKEISSSESHGVQYWPLILLSNNEFIGCCGLRPYKPGEKIYEMGIHLCSNHWGKGYATEAGEAVMKYAFGVLGAEVLFAGHNPKNDSSRHLLQKLGFRYTHDEYYEPTGLYHPSYLLTAEEFLAMKKTRTQLDVGKIIKTKLS